MYKWLYKETIETGIMVLLEDVDGYKKQGYVDSPDDYNKDESVSLETMTKDELEVYAREMFGIDIDKRKNNKKLVREIETLEAGLK